MALKAVFFDVGETLVDETRAWERAADAAGVPRFTLIGLVGASVARGAPHTEAFELLGVEPPETAAFGDEEFYPDALPCLEALRARGLRLGAVGNMRAIHEQPLREHVDVVGSSESWGVSKPDTGFFARLVAEASCAPAEVAYVGDRVDNDVEPALRAGMVAVHVRRGPWGYLFDPPEAALRVPSLSEVPEVLDGV